MPPPLHLAEQRFGRLVAVEAAVVCGMRGWLCRCDCGTEVVVRTAALQNGNTTSCGCRRADTHHAKARPLLERLLEKVTYCPITGCWWWTAHVNEWGYGTTSAGGKGGASLLAHRALYTELRGPIPDGKLLRHSCHAGQFGCVNPWHQQPGTDAENIADSLAAGRIPVKVDDAGVAVIRAARAAKSATVYELADQFDISIAQVSRIANGLRRTKC